MSTERSSLVRAMEEESGSSLEFEFGPSPEQLDMLALENRQGITRDGLRNLRLEQRRRGRPAGAQNKRNKDVARWFVAKYGDPLSVLGEIMNTPPDLLYQQMVAAQGGERKSKRITGADAIRLRNDAAKEVLPYIHGKQPLRVDVTKRADVILNIPGLTDPAHLAELTGDQELTDEDLSRLEFVEGDTLEGSFERTEAEDEE